MFDITLEFLFSAIKTGHATIRIEDAARLLFYSVLAPLHRPQAERVVRWPTATLNFEGQFERWIIGMPMAAMAKLIKTSSTSDCQWQTVGRNFTKETYR
ncbi:hypothetical protein A5792_16855 [Mycolicibacterium peregrinum]|uniref:Uncharacterized protein n=1 Tax=Mycolicibacterium peregrinum TaxID=43304 RepID=A0A1A0RAB5_MYCPR|nr:hypothetical protein A5792_16855 [Mycolicibacterium peregrinum]